ncbi:MAG: hypothetical protein ACJ8HC_18515, partial [Paraburkholderia graminis]|uniref:hypothetical protein n=1 Tax=Paraburkholderia graminis TaxID=60548 RepID=UPI00389AADEB
WPPNCTKASVPICRRRKRSNAFGSSACARMALKKKRRALCGARRFSHLKLNRIRAAARNEATPRTPRKKIPALRRANDTSFNVSERSAN